MSRRTWTYTLGGRPLPEPLEVTPGAEPEGYNASAERMPVFTDRYMEGVTSPIDGADIGSRAKRREYMQQRGLVDADDYRGEWAKAREQRREFRRSGEDGKDWGGRIAATYEQMRRR